jgi:hypothetical protein
MSNSLVQHQFGVLKQTMALREEIVNLFSDADLAFHPGGDALTLGALCRENGEIQHAYIESFKTFKTDFSYRHPDPTIATSVARLKAWFAELDAELLKTLEALSEDDIQNKPIDRGGWTFPVTIQFHVYREALLIFGGKISIYLQLLQKPTSKQWQEWIG